MYGKGLWGPIWGYIALKSDLNTIYGIMFDHKDETPGLGAEITKPWFREQFEGRKIFDDEGNFVSVAVVKGGAEPNNPHQVDAITGATLTSKGVDRMLRTCLQDYVNFIKKYQSQNSHAHE
jgi:Na+-transporting NADH:ubiquinone oxidoreductase subunit C